MNRRQAEHAVKKILMTGYGHYSRAEEHKIIMAFLQGNQVQLNGMDLGDMKLTDKDITKYPLAAQPLRAMKNSLICSVAVLCRYAADLGADDEKCFALSDYYINEIEARADMSNWSAFLEEILGHYRDLVRAGREKRYSLPVRRAIQYIEQHLYDVCRLQDAAKEIRLHSGYLSALFRTETGVSFTEYIRSRKMDEARDLLRFGEYTISEIAEMLGYQSLSYFSKVFRRANGCSPREFAAGTHFEG